MNDTNNDVFNKFNISQFVFKIAPIGISIIAAFFSYIAIDISKDAIELSELQFILKNRPYIKITFNKFDDKSFFIINESKNIIELKIKCKFENVGNVSAVDIRVINAKFYSKTLENKKIISDNFTIDIKKLEQLSLVPGENVSLDLFLHSTFHDKKSATKLSKLYISNEFEGLGLDLSVEYINELDKSRIYLTNVICKIQSDYIEILKLEKIDLNPDPDTI